MNFVLLVGYWLFALGSFVFTIDAAIGLSERISIHSLDGVLAGLLFSAGSIVFLINAQQEESLSQAQIGHLTSERVIKPVIHLKRILLIVLTALILLAPAAYCQSAVAQPMAISALSTSDTSTARTLDVEFKQLVDRNYAAWNTMKSPAVAKFYAQDADLVIYDALPLKYEGWNEFKSGIQTHLFDKLNRFQLTANDDLRATRQGDLVWATFTYHLSAQLKDGTPLEVEGRQTALWQQRNGQWLIVHEHTSAPVSL